MTSRRFSSDEIAYVRHSPTGPPFAHKRRRHTSVQKAGIAYERKVQGLLAQVYGDLYVPSPWFTYRLRGPRTRRASWCQPDGLLFEPGRQRITCIEVKLRHTPDAWHQLFEQYIPLLRFAFTAWKVAGCEVVRWYDPAISCPQRAFLCKRPEDVNLNAFGVHICRA